MVYGGAGLFSKGFFLPWKKPPFIVYTIKYAFSLGLRYLLYYIVLDIALCAFLPTLFLRSLST